MTEQFPAPWQLTGKGYIFLYRFSHDFVETHVNVPDFLSGNFCGGFGSVMLVDYATSNAGPYSELLFIPGKFHHQNGKLNSITSIYVSSMESVDNGRRNWAIPKELADFEFQQVDAKTEKITVRKEGVQIASFDIQANGLSFPVNTNLMPFPLVQQQDEAFYYTKFSGKGQGKIAKLNHIKINEGDFPKVDLVKPLMIIKVDPFQITFPIAEIKNQ